MYPLEKKNAYNMKIFIGIRTSMVYYLLLKVLNVQFLQIQHKLNNAHLVIEKNVIFPLIQDHQPGSIDPKINIHSLNISLKNSYSKPSSYVTSENLCQIPPVRDCLSILFITPGLSHCPLYLYCVYLLNKFHSPQRLKCFFV